MGPEVAARVAADLGWVMPLEQGGSLAFSARHSLLSLSHGYIDEAYDNELGMHELSFGVAWLQY